MGQGHCKKSMFWSAFSQSTVVPNLVTSFNKLIVSNRNGNVAFLNVWGHPTTLFWTALPQSTIVPNMVTVTFSIMVSEKNGPPFFKNFTLKVTKAPCHNYLCAKFSDCSFIISLKKAMFWLLILTLGECHHTMYVLKHFATRYHCAKSYYCCFKFPGKWQCYHTLFDHDLGWRLLYNNVLKRLATKYHCDKYKVPLCQIWW